MDLEEPTIHLDANKSSQSPNSTVAHDINKSEESDEDSFEKVDEIISDDHLREGTTLTMALAQTTSPVLKPM